jgi:hypothetical protein
MHVGTRPLWWIARLTFSLVLIVYFILYVTSFVVISSLAMKIFVVDQN